MRVDLAKTLTERERRGSRHMRFKNVRHAMRVRLDADGEANLPKFQGMYRPHTENFGETKDFSDVLSPLKGQVRKAVGRRWDSFYSELCKNLDRRSVQGEHVFQHLYDFCELEIQVIDGELWTKPAAYGSQIRKVKDDSTIEFYVDPRDNIIKRNKGHGSYRTANRRREAQKARELLAVHRVVSRDIELRKIDGVWFVLTYADVPFGEWVDVKTGDRAYRRVYRGPLVRDAFSGTNCYYEKPSRNFNPANRYCKSKRTASKKQLKEYGVKQNAPGVVS